MLKGISKLEPHPSAILPSWMSEILEISRQTAVCQTSLEEKCDQPQCEYLYGTFRAISTPPPVNQKLLVFFKSLIKIIKHL